MALDINHISKLLKKQITNYQNQVQSDDVGQVISVSDGIVLADGLAKVMAFEVVRFANNSLGLVLNLEPDLVGIVLLDNTLTIKEGDQVFATGNIIEVPVGDILLGKVVNALGQPLDGQVIGQKVPRRIVERIAPGVMTRQSVSRPLETGLKIIDSLIPIGKGQRELIIGDRQTGKSAIALDAIINQKGKKVKCVYVAIGQKASTIVQLIQKLKEHQAFEFTTIVAANSSDAPSLQYLAPYAGMAMAEE